MGQALLVAHLDPAQIEHRVLHGDLDPLAAPGLFPLQQRRQDAGDQVNPRSTVADLGAGAGRWAVLPAGRAHRSAHGLGDGLVSLALDEGAGPEALARGVDDAWIDLPNRLPGETLAVERPGTEVLHQQVADLDEPGEDLLALVGLGVDGDRALVAIEHGEIQAVDVGQVTELLAGDVAAARQLDLDDVGAEPRQ